VEFLSDGSRLRKAGGAGASLASEAEERRTLAGALDESFRIVVVIIRRLEIRIASSVRTFEPTRLYSTASSSSCTDHDCKRP
jgi:hypothetical protein